MGFISERTGRHRAPFLLAFAALTAAGSGALADQPVLDVPLDCTLGVDCYIQQFVDRATGPKKLDFGCGQLANDEHKGTDFAVPTLSHMEAGVTVLAAAPGIVKRLRDGMPDIDATNKTAPDLTDRECGNGVAIGHGEGWETQYCHMREGSVLVEEGQMVEAGTPLGLVGMSGLATFPHVHFSVRQRKNVIDPFRPDMTAPCGPQSDPGMWRQMIPYRPGGLLAAGVLNRVPEYDEVKAGLPGISLTDQPDAMVLWGYLFNGTKGDAIAFSMTGPKGKITSEQFVLEKSQPFLYRSWGKRRPGAGFARGRYLGEIRHLRNGEILDRRTVDFTLR